MGISHKVAERLNEIVAKARQVDELAAEVASASHEQTQGITQINAAVGQMDKVTQNNAASAEESAAAAEELNAQAGLMRGSVHELLKLVGGREGGRVRPAIPAETKRSTTASVMKSSRLAGNGQHLRMALPAQKLNCWEFKQCGREAGGAKARELGVCPAYPNHGHSCAVLAGTLCGGKVQGSFAQKLSSCMQCQFFNSPNYDRTRTAEPAPAIS